MISLPASAARKQIASCLTWKRPFPDYPGRWTRAVRNHAHRSFSHSDRSSFHLLSIWKRVLLAHSGKRASLLQGVDRREDGTGNLVSAVQHPVGECQHFTSIVAAERGEYHGTADEEEHCVAGNGEGRRVPPGEVESEG